MSSERTLCSPTRCTSSVVRYACAGERGPLQIGNLCRGQPYSGIVLLVTTFSASDGVPLWYDRRGVGEPLLLVHGGSTTHQCFDLVVDIFANSFSVFRYDRRGHGESAAGAWTFQRDVDDLIELAGHVDQGSGVRLLGYSFGGSIALHAAGAAGPLLRSLVVYEPPFGVPGMVEAEPQITALLAEGRRDEALRLFVSKTFHLSNSLVERMSRDPMWQVALGAVPNLGHEVAVISSLQIPMTREAFPPTRVLVAESGGNRAFHHIAASLHEAIGSHTVRVPGVPHFAMASAPEPFAAAAVEHLRST